MKSSCGSEIHTAKHKVTTDELRLKWIIKGFWFNSLMWLNVLKLTVYFGLI